MHKTKIYQQSIFLTPSLPNVGEKLNNIKKTLVRGEGDEVLCIIFFQDCLKFKKKKIEKGFYCRLFEKNFLSNAASYLYSKRHVKNKNDLFRVTNKYKYKNYYK